NGGHVCVVDSNVAWFCSSASLTIGWHFVAVTFDGSSHVWHIYIDGNSADANSMTHALSAAASTQAMIGKARENGNANYSFTYGAIDELGYWMKVLSSQELADLYDGGAGQTMVGSNFTFYAQIKNASTLNLRQDPNTSAAILKTLPGDWTV